MKKMYAMIAILLLGASFVFASIRTGPEMIWGALDAIRYFFCTIIPALMLVCFLLAAIMYAAGQMASSDQRARFHGWATSLVIGAITCGVMYVLGPWIITTVFGMPQSFILCS
jgi:hypothetical protein